MNNDRICTYCGAHMSASHQFCPSCGNRVNHNYPKQHPNRSSTPKRENDTLLFTITAILIVLLVIICLLTYLLNNVNKKTFKPGTEPLPIVSSSPSSTINNAGSPSYPSSDDFLFPSDRQIISTTYLSTLSQETVALIRNEIYARHGYIFNKDVYRDYFSSKSWYKPDPFFSEDMFNNIERSNKSIIAEYEKSRGWR